MDTPVDVRHEREANRFAATVDGHECELDYRIEGTVLTILHTGVPVVDPPLREVRQVVLDLRIERGEGLLVVAAIEGRSA